MFFLNGKYTSTIQVNGVKKIISRIGPNRVFYHYQTHRIEQIGVDLVVYDELGEYIVKIGELDVLYDAETGRMSSIGKLSVNYNEQTRCIERIGDFSVGYANAPEEYERIQGDYYSPIKTNAEAEAESVEESKKLQPFGLNFESANRERMNEFIAALSNPVLRESALFKIELNVRQEQEDRAKYDHFSRGYCSEALKLAAVKKIAQLLTESDANVRCKAQLALLTLSKSITATQRPEFMQQIMAEASLIITSLVTVMSISIENSSGNLKKEIQNALDLFAIFPFSDPEIQKLIIDNKIIPLLVDKRRDCVDCETRINQLLENFIKTSPAYKNVTIRAIKAEKLAQTPLPFTGGDLKNYYMSHSVNSFKGSMFNDVGSDANKLDTLLETLQERAAKKPGGASEKTLNHFILGYK